MNLKKKFYFVLPVMSFLLLPNFVRAELPLANISEKMPSFMAKEALEEVLTQGNLDDVLDDFKPKSDGWVWTQVPVRSQGGDAAFEFRIERKAPDSNSGWWSKAKNVVSKAAMRYMVGSDKLVLRGVVTARAFDQCPKNFEKMGYQVDVDLSKSDAVISNDIAQSLSIQICFHEVQKKGQGNSELSLLIQMGMDPGAWYKDKERDYFLKNSDPGAEDFIRSQVSAWTFALMNATTLHRAKLESKYYQEHPETLLP